MLSQPVEDSAGCGLVLRRPTPLPAASDHSHPVPKNAGSKSVSDSVSLHERARQDSRGTVSRLQYSGPVRRGENDYGARRETGGLNPRG